MIVGLVGTLLLGTVIGGLNSTFLDQAEGHNQDLMDNLDGLSREVTLSENPDNAKNQIKSLLHFNILRGAHCGILNEANDNSDIDWLDETKGFGKFQNLPCDTQEEVLNVNQPLDKYDSFLKNDYLEANGADQEGRYGSIKFNYPGESPIVIGSGDFFREPDIGQIVDIGDDKTARAGPGPERDWAGVYYKDANYGGGSVERGILYYPDPQIGVWAETDNKLDTPSPPYEDNYPYGEFAPVIENAPLVNSTPLSRELVGTGTNMESLIDYGSRLDDEEPTKFEIVICSGSTGTIQANSGGPYQDGEATDDGDEKRMYPFVRIDPGSPTSCVEEHVITDPDFQTAKGIANNKEFEIDMKLGDAGYEGGRNSPCGPGRIRFYNENGDDFQIKFDGSESCDMEVEWSPGVLSDDSDTYYVDQGETAEYRIVEGSDATVFVGDNEYELPNEEPVKITEVEFRGSTDGLKLNPDYFDGVIKKFEVKYGSVVGSYSLLDQEFRSSFNLNEQGNEDSGWSDGEYRISAAFGGNNHEVRWDISGINEDIEHNINQLSCEGLEDARSDESSSFELGSKNFEVRCGLNPMSLQGISTDIYEDNSRADTMSVERYIGRAD